jgi:cholest-4-en-3-one 26-monooxygenase
MSDTGSSETSDRDLLSPDQYARHGYPHAAWARLRREDPVHWVAEWAGDPYWAITRHREIIEISKHPDLFLSSPGFTLSPHGEEAEGGRNLLDMDPPEHQTYRSLVSKRFTPRALVPLQKQVDQITNEVLDRVVTGGETARIDFVEDVAALLPIWVIAEMLGVPNSDWMNLFHWTNAAVGAADPEYQQGRSVAETRAAAIQEMFGYFEALSEDRRRNPQDDLASVLVHARIEGEPMPVYERLSYFAMLLAAGNETTRNATSGGLLALIENPDQLELVRHRPDLLDGLVEEILRYVSPVIHMCRTAAHDIELTGRTIRAGQRVVLFYPSANRDESVFDEPDQFRIERHPNRHLAFGVGEHVCLGSHVARMELRAIFRHLANRLDFVEVDGPVERLRMNVVGGIKHLPIRYRLRPVS